MLMRRLFNRFHNFVFELDAELQWINEHLPAATSDAIGQNLHQAQSLYKKHKKLQTEISGHEPMIKRALTSGQALVDQKHPEKKKVNFHPKCVILRLNSLNKLKVETNRLINNFHPSFRSRNFVRN